MQWSIKSDSKLKNLFIIRSDLNNSKYFSLSKLIFLQTLFKIRSLDLCSSMFKSKSIQLWKRYQWTHLKLSKIQKDLMIDLKNLFDLDETFQLRKH